MGEQELMRSLYRLKRNMFRFTLELVLFAVSIVFILAGAVLVLRKIFPLEWVLLVSGLVLLNLVLLTAKFR